MNDFLSLRGPGAGLRPTFKNSFLLFPLALACALISEAHAQVPGLLSYQGRVLVSGNAFTGAGKFKFALVDGTGTQVYWGNAADNNSDGQPDTNVVVAVNGGIFTVLLGDTNLPGMLPLPTTVFTNSTVFLRIWFDDGSHGNQLLTPDQRVASAAYAMMAGNITDGSVTLSKLAASAGFTVTSADPQDPSLTAKGFVPFSNLPAPDWISSSAASDPSPRSGQASVWTGQEFLIWGGNVGGGLDVGTGGRYRPDLDQWQLISTINLPSAREQHTAVWSGLEMLVWGGNSAGSFINTGGRFNPSNQLWTTISTTNAPAGRSGQVAIWTGGRMVIVGGHNNLGVLADAAMYDPTANTWTTISLANAPAARTAATAVWTGSRLIVWGGQNETGGLNSGAQLIFSGNVPTAWSPVSTVGAPAGRTGHAAVWTGQKMLIWGGSSGGAALGDGAAYDPIADAWTPLNSTNAPSARSSHSAVWTGQEMLVFGGETLAGTAGDGAAYDPIANKWRPLSNSGMPLARSSASAAWTGSLFLVFGGVQNGTLLGSLQSLNPQPTWYLYRKP